MKTEQDELQNRSALSHIASRAFSRTAGAPLIPGNRVRLLRDAQENYPAWLEAIRRAQQHVHFESYVIHEDDTGREFADALIAKAREGVHVRLIYDWMGGLGKTSARFWTRLRTGGVEVRCYNPPHFDSPFGWLSRDHRKMLAVDGRVGRGSRGGSVEARRRAAACRGGGEERRARAGGRGLPGALSPSSLSME